MNLAGRFIIDGYDLYEAFKVVVQEAQGLDVLPKVKKRTERDWPEESGVDVDTTTDLTYEAHDITLDCYVQESTYADAVKRINGVVKLLSSDGYHLLGSQLRQRLYPVLLQEVTGYKRITPASASAIYVQFTLKLRCPLPETRIGNATVEASGQVTLVVPTGKDFTVWWGDGTVNENTLTHTYTEAGTYTVLIAGTGVTSVVITGINIAEFSYPATGDITHVDVSHTSEEVWKDFNEHAQATTNPHATNVTQEFAEIQITPLAVEATYTPTVWSYLVSLFTTVPKSVKEHIVKGWTVIENLKSRVTEIETKIIADITVAEEVSAVDITGLNIKEGETVAVQFHGEQFIIPPNTSAYMYILVNEISDNLYSNAATAGGIVNYNSFRITMREKTTFQLFFTLINGKVLISGEAMSVGGTTPYAYIISGILISSITSISSINFSSSSIGSYKAGDNIRVVKL